METVIFYKDEYDDEPKVGHVIDMCWGEGMYEGCQCFWKKALIRYNEEILVVHKTAADLGYCGSGEWSSWRKKHG